MAKKSASNQPKSTVSTIIAAVVIIIALILGNLLGVDVGGMLGITTPVATNTALPATSAPPTAVANLPTLPVFTSVPGSVTTIPVQQGFGAQKGFWQVYFTAPTGSRDPSTYTGGIDTILVNAINGVQRTLDIAAFEWNLQSVTNAVLAARQRGVQVRIVGDDEHNVNDSTSLIGQLISAGIPVVSDNRSAFMHNKFMIMDSTSVLTGSWNFTINDTYRNNNNAIYLRSRQAVANYQAEFNEMFVDQRFGPRSPSQTPNSSFTQDGIPIQVYFAPEDQVLPAIISALNSARSTIRFMTFSFTEDSIGQAILGRASAGVGVQGIFETTGSETQFSELTPLFCAGLQVRQDGNPFTLHHKVFIIDNTTVVTGSFNISANATTSNDENLVIISDPDLAAQYVTEFNRRWQESRTPANLTCS
jgi:phosphatidylserine/phosphatidylglycerophosphate/cardiolipin synthase-like enzyme